VFDVSGNAREGAGTHAPCGCVEDSRVSPQAIDEPQQAAPAAPKQSPTSRAYGEYLDNPKDERTQANLWRALDNDAHSIQRQFLEDRRGRNKSGRECVISPHYDFEKGAFKPVPDQYKSTTGSYAGVLKSEVPTGRVYSSKTPYSQVVDEAVTRTWKDIQDGKFDPTKGKSFRSWAWDSLIGNIKNEVDKISRQPELETTGDRSTPFYSEAEVARNRPTEDLTPFQSRLVEQFREKLVSIQRNVFDLRREGYTQEEIGQLLGLTQQAVNKHLGRIKAMTEGFHKKPENQ
jgi:RNA polymerase sigma factor (sigma-70 family)